jgi:hypothetical protein
MIFVTLFRKRKRRVVSRHGWRVLMGGTRLACRSGLFDVTSDHCISNDLAVGYLTRRFRISFSFASCSRRHRTKTTEAATARISATTPMRVFLVTCSKVPAIENSASTLIDVEKRGRCIILLFACTKGKLHHTVFIQVQLVVEKLCLSSFHPRQIEAKCDPHRWFHGFRKYRAVQLT